MELHISVYHSDIALLVFYDVALLQVGGDNLPIGECRVLLIYRFETKFFHIGNTFSFRQRCAAGEVYYRLLEESYKFAVYLAVAFNGVSTPWEHGVEQRYIVNIGAEAFAVRFPFRHFDYTLTIFAEIHIGVRAAAYRLTLVGEVRYVCVPIACRYCPLFEEFFFLLLNRSFSLCSRQSLSILSDCAFRYS